MVQPARTVKEGGVSEMVLSHQWAGPMDAGEARGEEIGINGIKGRKVWLEGIRGGQSGHRGEKKKGLPNSRRGGGDGPAQAGNQSPPKKKRSV